MLTASEKTPGMAISAPRIVTAVENSLRRLQTDHIDLYQVHRPDPDTDYDETLGALTDLVRQGKVRYIGSSSFSGSQIVEAQWTARERGLEVRECAIPRELLYLADEAFLTGTAVEVTAIRSVDGIQIGAGRAGPITESLQNAFYGLFSGKTADKWGWLDYVDMSAPRVAASG